MPEVFNASSWLPVIATGALVVIAFCAVIAMSIFVGISRFVKSRSSFSEGAQPLLDKGQLEPLIRLCRERLETFHDDTQAHYFIGLALFRKGELRAALNHMKKLTQLDPSWNVDAMILAIETQLGEQKDKPELKIVESPPTGERDSP